jgi:glycosyltransferase involved in cell wall biosynthesis
MSQNVIHVTWSLVAGGAEMYALTIASHLDRQGFRSVMCVLDQGGALEPEIQRLGIPYIIMHRRPGIDLRLMWRMFRLFRKHQVDVVHTHHFNQLFYSVLGAKLVGARIIHTEHSTEVYKKRRLRIALRVLARFCHKVIAIGNDGYQVLHDQVGIASEKLQVLRAGVDVSRFKEPRASARRELELSDQDRVAVIVARLFPEKNHLLLLEAFAKVVERVSSARLLIAGEGTEDEAIVAAMKRLGLQHSVRMLGVRRDVPRLLAAADLFVLCSDREGLPIAVLEAMAAARPVVATAVGDLPTVVQDHRTGRLVAPKDPDALAEALVEVLSHPDYARLMGEFGREVVARHYSVRTMISAHEALYAGAPAASTPMRESLA